MFWTYKCFFFCGRNDCHPAKTVLSDVWNYNCGSVCGLWRCLKCPYLLSNSTSAQRWSWLDNHPISIVMLPFGTGNTPRRYRRLYEYRVPYFDLMCLSPKQQSVFLWEGRCCANCNHVTCCATNKKKKESSLYKRTKWSKVHFFTLRDAWLWWMHCIL